MSRLLLMLYLVCLGVAITGCATTEKEPPKTQPELLAEKGLAIDEEVDGISNYVISSWRYLDEYGLILRGGVKQEYLVTLSFPCRELRWTETIGMTSTISRLTSFDKVLVKDSSRSVPKSCPIKAIYLLTDIEQNALEDKETADGLSPSAEAVN